MPTATSAVTVAVNHELIKHTLSLDEFVVCWSTLQQEDSAAAAALALVGILNDGEQVSIDVYKYFHESIEEVVDRAAMTRDYDSLSGISQTLPYIVEGDILVSPPLEHTLLVDNHMKMEVYGERSPIRLCKIPNVPIARFGNRCLVRLICPEMYKSGDSVVFDEPRLKRLYQHGIRPAFETSLREHHGGNVTAGQELYLLPSRDHWAAHGAGHHQHSVRQLPTAIIQRFGELLLDNLADIPGFAGCVYYHEIMGVKMAHCHDPEDAQERENHLKSADGLLGIFDPGCPPRNLEEPEDQTELWSADVGVEFSVRGHVLHWQRGSHPKILASAFPNSNERIMSEIIDAHQRRSTPNTSGPYRLDSACSLHQVGGFFFDGTHPSAERAIDGHDETMTAIAYCTDKTLFIKRGRESKGAFSAPSCSNVASPAKFEKNITEHVDKILQLLMDAGRLRSTPETQEHEDGSQPMQLGAARLEVRIPVHAARDALVSVPESFRKDTLLSIPPETWWAFKISRIHGILHLLTLWTNMKSRWMKFPRALSLVPQLMFIFTAVFSREPQGRWEAASREKIPMRIIDNEFLGPEDTTQDRGVLFLAGFTIHPGAAIRVLEGHKLPEDCLIRAYLNVPDNCRSPPWTQLHSLFKLKWTEAEKDDQMFESDDSDTFDNLVKKKRRPAHSDRTRRSRLAHIWVTDIRKMDPPWPESLETVLRDMRHRFTVFPKPYFKNHMQLEAQRREMSPDPVMNEDGETFNVGYQYGNKDATDIMRDMFNQFVFECLDLSPSPQSRHLPRHLLFKDPFAWTMDIFTHFDLRGLLNHVFILVLPDNEFVEEAMRHFPDHAVDAKIIKWTQYIRMVEHVQRNHLYPGFPIEFRKYIRRIISQLVWFPRFNQGTWRTSKTPDRQHMLWASPSTVPGGIAEVGKAQELPDGKSDVTRISIIAKLSAFRRKELKLGPGPQPYIGPDGSIEILPYNDEGGNGPEAEPNLEPENDPEFEVQPEFAEWTSPPDWSNIDVETLPPIHAVRQHTRSSLNVHDRISQSIRNTTRRISNISASLSVSEDILDRLRISDGRSGGTRAFLSYDRGQIPGPSQRRGETFSSISHRPRRIVPIVGSRRSDMSPEDEGNHEYPQLPNKGKGPAHRQRNLLDSDNDSSDSSDTSQTTRKVSLYKNRRLIRNRRIHDSSGGSGEEGQTHEETRNISNMGLPEHESSEDSGDQLQSPPKDTPPSCRIFSHVEIPTGRTDRDMNDTEVPYFDETFHHINKSATTDPLPPILSHSSSQPSEPPSVRHIDLSTLTRGHRRTTIEAPKVSTTSRPIQQMSPLVVGGSSQDQTAVGNSQPLTTLSLSQTIRSDWGSSEVSPYTLASSQGPLIAKDVFNGTTTDSLKNKNYGVVRRMSDDDEETGASPSHTLSPRRVHRGPHRRTH